MKGKRLLTGILVSVMALSMAGCGSAASSAASTAESAEESTVESSAATEESIEESAEASEASEEAEEPKSGDISEGTMRIGSLKGPTTMGLVSLMAASENGESEGNYEFTMETQADVILAGMVKGDLDVALVPANLASVMYNKTEGGVSVIDVNTLGVLYCVTADESITSTADLAGREVITTGQGSSPEYVINYLLSQNNVTDCTVTFKSEATEVAASLKEDPMQIAVLPQPFVTVAEAQNDQLKTAFSLTDEWNAVNPESKLLTGVTVVRNDYLAENEAAVKLFIDEQSASVDAVLADPAKGAELIASYGIIEKAPIAQKALPFCNLVCLKGAEMKAALSGYLQVLYDSNPASVGGKMPSDDFYYIAE